MYHLRTIDEHEEKTIIFEVDSTDEIDTITFKVLENNRINALIPMEYEQINNEISLRYVVNGMNTLRKLVENNQNITKILKLLQEIIAIISRLEDYMIDEAMIVMDPSYIFIDDSEKVQLVCIPVKNLKMPTLSELLTDILNQASIKNYIGLNEYDELIDAIQHINNKAQLLSKLESIELNMVVVNKKDSMLKSNGPVILNSDVRQKEEKKPVILAKNRKTTVLQLKDKKINNSDSFQHSITDNLSVSPLPDYISVEIIETEATEIMDIQDECTHIEEFTKIETVDDEATVIEVRNKSVKLRLQDDKRCKVPNEIDLPMISGRCVVGRFNKMGQPCADYNFDYSLTIISRNHFMVWNKDDEFYIRDMGSKNGTLLNGELLSPERDYVLHQGDVIELSKVTKLAYIVDTLCEN